MTIFRAGLMAIAALFGTLLASSAFAGCFGCCGGCGYAVTYAPVAYAQPLAYAAPVPLAYAPPPAPQPLIAAPPVAPLPLVPAPIGVTSWDTGGWGGWGGCGGCGGCGVCGGSWGWSNWGGWNGWNSWGGGCGGCGGGLAALYVVNQGPYYSGPGVMVPYGTYSPYAGVGAYPYVGGGYPYVGGGYGYGYGGLYGYRHHYYRHPNYWRG